MIDLALANGWIQQLPKGSLADALLLKVVAQMHSNLLTTKCITPICVHATAKHNSSIPFCVARQETLAMETWQTRAKSAMKAHGLTQDALAERLEVTQGAVQHWLSGSRKPDLELLLAIATQIGVSPAWLLLGLDENSQLAGLPPWAVEPLTRVIQGTRAGQLDAEWFARFELALQLVGLPSGEGASALMSTPEVHAKARAQRNKTATT